MSNPRTSAAAESAPQCGASLEGTPAADRERAVVFLRDWLSREPSTLALFRYPLPREEDGAGLFKPLGTTDLVAVEQDGGMRDGHEYWRHGRGWAVHVRWYGLHWILLHLQRRHDDQGLREALDKGVVLLDKVEFARPLVALARKAVVYKNVPAREVYRFRMELSGLMRSLDDLFALSGAIDQDQLHGLFDAYLDVIRIAERLSPRSDEAIRKGVAWKLGKAGRSRADFSSAIGTVRGLADRLLKTLGGPAHREFYAPAGAVLSMPPDENGQERQTTPQFEEFLCTHCERRFAIPLGPGIPVLAGEPASAPEMVRASAHGAGR